MNQVSRISQASAGAPLPGRAGERDRARAEALHREREVRQPRVAGERLADQAQRARVQRLARAAAGRPGDGVPQPAGVAEPAHERLAFGVDVRSMRVRNVGRGPLVERTREHAVSLVEEGPIEVAGIAHRMLL